MNNWAFLLTHLKTSLQITAKYILTCICCRGITRRNSFWDYLIFNKVQEGMGGRLRLLVVGSAPLAGNVLTFTRCALGCVVSNRVYSTTLYNVMLVHVTRTVIRYYVFRGQRLGYRLG